jgi:hypothetical protein
MCENDVMKRNRSVCDELARKANRFENLRLGNVSSFTADPDHGLTNDFRKRGKSGLTRREQQ